MSITVFCGDDSPFFAVNVSDEHDVQSHMFRPAIVVAAEGRHLCILALNKVNIVAVTTILVLHVGNGRSEHV